MWKMLSTQELFQNALLTMQKSSHLGGPMCHGGHMSSQAKVGYLPNHLVHMDGPEITDVSEKQRCNLAMM